MMIFSLKKTIAILLLFVILLKGPFCRIDVFYVEIKCVNMSITGNLLKFFFVKISIKFLMKMITYISYIGITTYKSSKAH